MKIQDDLLNHHRKWTSHVITYQIQLIKMKNLETASPTDQSHCIIPSLIVSIVPWTVNFTEWVSHCILVKDFSIIYCTPCSCFLIICHVHCHFKHNLHPHFSMAILQRQVGKNTFLLFSIKFLVLNYPGANNSDWFFIMNCLKIVYPSIKPELWNIIMVLFMS